MIPKYKDIMDLIKKGATLEAQEKIIELREVALELQEENQELKQQVRDLTASLDKKQNVVWEEPSYWSVNGEINDGPFCQKCYDVDKNLVRLQGGKNDSWQCKACKSSYRGPNYTPIQMKPSSGFI